MCFRIFLLAWLIGLPLVWVVECLLRCLGGFVSPALILLFALFELDLGFD